MQTTLRRHPFPALSAAGNGEERAAQIKSIQERIERLQHVHEQVTTEVRRLTEDVRVLKRDGGPVTVAAPAKAHN